MAVTPFKTFSAGEILTAADLNSSFSQITSNGEDLGWPATKAKDLNGNELILDGDADTSITADTDDQVDFKLGGVDVLRLNTVVSAVNGIDFTAAATGTAPFFSAFGTDTNVNIDLKPKGTGGARFLDKNGNEILVGADGTASAVNELTLANAATGNDPQVQASGDDTNIGINLVPKGAGTVQVGGSRVLAEDHIPPITTRGDIVRGNASGVPERLTLGTKSLLLGSDGTDVVYVGGSDGKVGAYTVVAPDDHMKSFRAAGTFSFTLPTLTASGDFFQFTVVNVGTGIITLDGNGAETFRGPDGTTTTITLPSFGDSITVVNGTNWEVSSIHRKPIHGLQTEQATTSGTAIDFTGIPADTQRITVMFEGVSLSGTDEIMVQLGDAGGFETSGYAGLVTDTSTTVNFAASFQAVANGIAAGLYHGQIVLTLMDASTFTWVASGIIVRSAAASVNLLAGTKSLSAVLTQLRITRTGTDTFDAGAVNILVE